MHKYSLLLLVLVNIDVYLQPGMYVTLHIANVPSAVVGKFVFTSVNVVLHLAFLSKPGQRLMACNCDNTHKHTPV